MKKYVFEVVITEGNDEFWEELEREGKSGCDEMTKMLKECVPLAYYDHIINLQSYTNT